MDWFNILYEDPCMPSELGICKAQIQHCGQPATKWRTDPRE